MWKATVRGIVAHRTRLVLSVVAVMLGVAFVAGTYVLTDTLVRSYDGLFAESVRGVDLVVRLEGPSGPEGTRERFPDGIVDQVGAVPGVASAHGLIQGYAQFVDRDGDAIRRGGGPTLALSWAQDGRQGPLRLVGARSRPPSGPGEVAMDVATAREFGFRVGDRVRVLLQGPAQELRISGLFGLGDRVDLGAVTFAAFDLPTAQVAVGAPGEVDAVYVRAEPGVPLESLRRRIAASVGPAFRVQLADEAAADTGRVVRDLLDLLTRILLGFAAIGVVIAALLVFNTFTIVVAQRTRELGLLRVVGASRSQLVGALLVEALVVGAVASLAGLGLGIGVAAGLLAVVEQLGFAVPERSLVVELRTVVVALGLGVLVTVAAVLRPALRASREAPLAALHDVVVASPRRLRVRAAVGTTVVALSLVLLAVGLDRTRDARRLTGEFLWVAAGAMVLLVGVVILLATFAGPMAGGIGRAVGRRGMAGRLARENSVRNPRRTAATASALVIGLTLVVLVAVVGDSTKTSVRAAVDQGIRADAVLKSERFAGFSPEVADRVAALPGVRAVTPLQFRRVRILGNEETVASALADGLAATVDLDLVAGRIEDLEPSGILVHEDAARDYGVGLRDVMLVQMSRGTYPLRVAAIYRRADFTGGLPISFVVPRAVYLRGFGTDEQDTLVYVAARGDPDPVLAAIRRDLRTDFPNLQVLSRDQYRSEQERAIDRFLAVTVALLLLAEIIAVLGIVNTLALSVFERTRELGLLRAVGMTRAQARAMIRGEAVVIAALGAVVGIAVGVVWGFVFTTALRSQGITTLSIPLVQLAVFLVVAVLAGVVAAWFPARRAARLDVLAAIAAE